MTIALIVIGVIARLMRSEVTSPAGEQLEIEGAGFRGMGSSVSTGSGWSRSVIGTVEISTPGAYRVTAGPELPDAVEPQVLIGK